MTCVGKKSVTELLLEFLLSFLKGLEHGVVAGLRIEVVVEEQGLAAALPVGEACGAVFALFLLKTIIGRPDPRGKEPMNSSEQKAV